MKKRLKTREVNLKLPILKPKIFIEITPVVGSYSTENTEFGNQIKIIRDKITTYIQRHQSSTAKRPYNILLSAPPGMGKSFLAKELAKDASIKAGANFEFDEVFIASMDSVNEIDDVFRRIQSVFLDNSMPVILFDEIDSRIGNVNVYNRFLSPMWDGNFFIGSHKYALPPCIFFFAGSTISSEKISKEAISSLNREHSYDRYRKEWEKLFFNEIKSAKSEKITDFIDRIDDIIRIPPIDGLMPEPSIVKEYEKMACVLIQEHHTKEMKNIHRLVIQALAKTIRSGSIRKAEKIIFSSTPTPPEFPFHALPEDFKKQSGISESQHNIKTADDLIGIKHISAARGEA